MPDSRGHNLDEIPYVGGRDERGPVSDVSVTAGVGRKMRAEEAANIPLQAIRVAVTRDTQWSDGPAQM